jgi:trigger factor
MELTRRPLVVKDEAVESALSHVQQEHTELLPIEDREELADSDIVMFKAAGKIGEHDVDRPQLTVDLSQPDREPLPGLARALIGVSIKAEDHELVLEVPEDYTDDTIAGKTATLSLTVLDARRKEVPALDDELAKDTGKAETLDELRKVLRDELEARMAEEIENELRDAAQREIVKRNQIPIAQSLIDRAVESKLARLQQMFGIDAGQDGFDDELKGKLRADAADEVRGQLLVDAVATAESIEVTDEEIDARIEKMAETRNQQANRLRAEMDRDGRLDNLRFQIRHEKSLDFLISKAVVTEKEPEPAVDPDADADSESETEAKSGKAAKSDKPAKAAKPKAAKPKADKAKADKPAKAAKSTKAATSADAAEGDSGEDE